MHKYVRFLYPQKQERDLLGGFYLSSFLSEVTNIVLPFQFIFLFLVMDKPEWAVIPLVVEGLTVFLLEIPTGVIADRFGRKVSVIIGDLLSGIAWLFVPLAIVLDGPVQLLMVSLAFAVEGVGQTLVSGAEEAWVIDNLIAEDQEDITDQYFAREKSISSIAGVVSGLVAWFILSTMEVTATVVGALWIVAGLGQILGALVQISIPEKEIAASKSGDGSPIFEGASPFSKSEFAKAASSIWNLKPLLAFVVVTLVLSLSTAVTGDAFEISMVANGMNPKELAPIVILTDLLGFIAPLIAVLISRRMGPFNFLSTLLVLPVIAISGLFLSPPLLAIVCLLIFFNLIDDLWDPIADAILHSYIPSSVRATVGSIVNQFSELVGLAGLAIFALMLGKHSEQIDEAIPNLVDAFKGVLPKNIDMPLSFFGLEVQDSALVLFTVASLLAVPIMMLFPWSRYGREIKYDDILEPAPEKSQSPQSNAVDPVLTKKAIEVRQNLDDMLERYNPGELLSWNISPAPFELPKSTIDDLRVIGPLLTSFFEAANKIFYQEEWIQQRLEKHITPHYKLLNRCQPDAVPRLIRPDVVCDENWVPKLVELEITVGARADTAAMSKQYKIPRSKSVIESYSRMAKGLASEGKNLALVTAPHPFFLDLPDDAKAFAGMLRESGVDNIVVLTEDNLSSLRFADGHLWLNERFKEPQIIHVIDRFIDIYEIAELQHAGMGAILDAYLAGAITDINTVKQCLDEKDWMSLFWDKRLEASWHRELGIEKFEALQKWIPKTWIISKDLMVCLNNGEEINVLNIGQIKPDQRTFIIKESGTSTTASGAQSFYPLATMNQEEIEDVLSSITESGVEHILQELVESARLPYHALNPDDDVVSYHPIARFKISPFYIDGSLSDIRFVASATKYAVNDDENCVVSVVRY
jgi:MFS family permease